MSRLPTAVIPVTVDTRDVDAAFVTDHLRIGLNSLKQLINEGLTLKHLKF